MSVLSIKIPDVMERYPRDLVSKGRSSNLVYTIWAVFGGFILHFLLCNYLTVLLKPSYEEPVESAADIMKRDITPFLYPGSEIFIQFFAASPDPNFQEISRRFYISKDWDEYYDLVRKVLSTGLYAEMRTLPVFFTNEEYKSWYRSTETISGLYKYAVHLSNKKWPLKKVIVNCHWSKNFLKLYF